MREGKALTALGVFGLALLLAPFLADLHALLVLVREEAVEFGAGTRAEFDEAALVADLG
jgi:hypothetical protein